jgi:pectin methylesterase-like acyl-CoA thioesterase
MRIARSILGRAALVFALVSCSSGTSTSDSSTLANTGGGGRGGDSGTGGGPGTGGAAPSGGSGGQAPPRSDASDSRDASSDPATAGGQDGRSNGGSPEIGAGGVGGGAGVAAGGVLGSGGATASGGIAGTGGAGSGGQSGLPAGVTALFPAPGATGVCPDPPLRMTFASPPTLGNSGKIQVFASSGTAIASIDMAAATITDTLGGTSFVLLRPVYVDGNSAVIYLKNKALGYGQTYYVTVDAGAIRPPGGTLAITGQATWRFTTAAAAPSSLSALTVALDGSGQFCTIQGATDALPANGTAASTISIAAGTYHEVMHVANKSNITLHGADRSKTLIVGTNNNTQQGSAAGTKNRALLGFDGTDGLVIENVTIQNLTPQGGSQAEALRIQSCDKCIVRNSDIWSLQDTLLWSGRIYAENDLIVGNVDYVWGTGVAYFNQCELRTVGISGGYIVQSRNAASAYGYVFVDCKLTVDSTSKNNWLARIDASAYPGSHVAYIHCQMTGIAAAGWNITGGSSGSLRFWEYQSTDASGNSLSTSGRTGGTQISASQAASMRDPTVVLAGWNP